MCTDRSPVGNTMKMMCALYLISLLAVTIVLSNVAPSGPFDERSIIENSGQPDSVALDNEYVRVLRNSAACTTAFTPHYGTRIIVALSTVRLQSGKGTRELTRGDIAVFLDKESYELPTGDFFEVAFKTNHPPLTVPEEWIEPQLNTIVYEDEQLRVFEERLPPGGERPLHSHAQRVVIRLNEVQLTDPRFNKKARPGSGIQVPNTVKFAEPVVHVVRNLSTIPLFNIVIEYKIPSQNYGGRGSGQR